MGQDPSVTPVEDFLQPRGRVSLPVPRILAEISNGPVEDRDDFPRPSPPAVRPGRRRCSGVSTTPDENGVLGPARTDMKGHEVRPYIVLHTRIEGRDSSPHRSEAAQKAVIPGWRVLHVKGSSTRRQGGYRCAMVGAESASPVRREDEPRVRGAAYVADAPRGPRVGREGRVLRPWRSGENPRRHA